MTSFTSILMLVVGAVLGGGLIAFYLRSAGNKQAEEERNQARKLLDEARSQSETLKREAELKAKELALQAKNDAEREARERNADLQQMEKRLANREQSIEGRANQIDKRESDLSKREQSLETVRAELAEKRTAAEQLIDEKRKELERVAELTRDEAKRTLIEEMTNEARHEAVRRIRLIEEEAKAEADRKAKRIVSIAIERMAGEYVTERTVSTVTLPNDEMKGRIIGREGRNIRAIEAATGVDLIVDDTPEKIVISCHNPIRREIARMAMEKLISDGRIHPGRVEEVVRKAEQELEEHIRDAGQKAVLEVGIHGVHPEIVKLIGMLKYRYSYAQNVLSHSIECAFLCGTMAGELGLNVKQARRAGLMHDIGKALTHEVEGSHAIIGADIARKYGESAKIVNAIAAHHEEVKAETVLAPLVDAADAISGARPGARREMLESYVKRLEDLERISSSFEGVEKTFALQAGRDLRIIVEPKKIGDDRVAALAHEVARKIENEMQYPGQIKVTVIREMRASDLAR